MKFAFISLRKNILPIVFILITICLVVFSKSNLTATKNGLALWATCVVPALFPFFVITNVLTQTKVVSFVGRLLDKFMRPFFNVPGVGGFAFIMGLISGYPVGAKIVSDFRENGLVTKDEGERMLAFTNNSGPLFIISSVGISLFGDTKTGMLLLLTHILSCITVGIILGKFSKKSDEEFRRLYSKSHSNNTISISYASNVKGGKKHVKNRINNELLRPVLNTKISKATRNCSKEQKRTIQNNVSSNNLTFKNLGEVLGNSINSSIKTILLIGGFVVIFSVLISILSQTHIIEMIAKFFAPLLSFLGFDTDFAKPLVSGILELTNGVNLVSDVHIKAISQNIVLCAFLLGFGGFSVLLQVFSIIAKTDLSIKKYFIGKLLQGIIAAIYTYLALKFIPFINLDIIETANATATSISAMSSATEFLHTYFYNLGVFTIAIFMLVAIYVLFNLIYKRFEH